MMLKVKSTNTEKTTILCANVHVQVQVSSTTGSTGTSTSIR